MKKNVTDARHKFWPLYSFRRNGESMRFRCLELWPLFETGGIERNWAPFWTLFRHERAKDFSETELLWGLFRRVDRKTDGYRNTSVFPLIEWGKHEAQATTRWQIGKGLLGYKKVRGKRKLKLLWLLEF